MNRRRFLAMFVAVPASLALPAAAPKPQTAAGLFINAGRASGAAFWAGVIHPITNPIQPNRKAAS